MIEKDLLGFFISFPFFPTFTICFTDAKQYIISVLLNFMGPSAFFFIYIPTPFLPTVLAWSFNTKPEQQPRISVFENPLKSASV